MSDPNLITSIIFQGREYLVKMNVINKYLEIIISDKQSGEEWQCGYDNSYIENLTHKTGNFKQFDVFVSMVKSGLLKTSDSIRLELLTFEDLEALRIRKIRNHSSRNFNNGHSNNRRYLIITYSVEFDRIHYPLPLEYCGPPDPSILQATIRKLEAELAKARDETSMKCNKFESRQMFALQRRVDELMTENLELRDEMGELSRINSSSSRGQVQMLQKAIVNLEKSVLSERKSHHKLVEKLRNDKIKLVKQLESAKNSERSLKLQLEEHLHKNRSRSKGESKTNKSENSLQTIYRRSSPVMRANSDGARQLRQRSVSPRMTKSEGWDLHKSPDGRLLTNPKVSKPRSRSSSLSSARIYNMGDVGYEAKVLGDRRTRSRRLCKMEKVHGSRNSSVSSTGSSVISDLSKQSVASIKCKIRNDKKDFKTLESRIQALQNILKENGP